MLFKNLVPSVCCNIRPQFYKCKAERHFITLVFAGQLNSAGFTDSGKPVPIDKQKQVDKNGKR